MAPDPSSPVKILVPLDGSEVALEILAHVEPLASRLDAEVILLRVVASLADTLAGSHVALDVATAEVEEDKQATKAYLETMAQPLRANGLRVETIVGEGAPAASILQHAEGVSFIAMTTHSRHGIGRNSPIPVIVTHPRHKA
jgi:nucleotide-binding universal stress UspA family protein